MSFVTLAALLMAIVAKGQVPQFSPSDYAGWVYNNPVTELNERNILADKILLYTNSSGLHQTLTSPQFNCFGSQVISMDITWITDQWQSATFNVDKVGITAAIINNSGVALDSVTFTPTASTVSRTNHVYMTLTVPRGMTKARLRFASWKADVNSCGAVKKIVMTSDLWGDVNLDGEVNVNDINIIIDVIQGGHVSELFMTRADVNHDGEITVNDINAVVDLIVG